MNLKALIPITLLVCSCLNTNAQQKHHGPTIFLNDIINRNYTLRTTIPFNNAAHYYRDQANTANKSTATSSRLISDCIRNYEWPNFEKYDSTHYFFSGTNHSEYNDYPKKCDSIYIYHFPAYSPDSNGGIWYQPLDTNGNVLKTYCVNKDFITLQQDTEYFDAYTYDNANNKLEFLQVSDWNGVWTAFYRDAYTYDGNNNMLTSLHQEWSLINNVWENFYRYEYVYNSNNLIIGMTYQEWVNNVWKNNTNDSMAYNNADSMIFYERRGWNSITNTFKAHTRYYTQYNNDGCPIYGWTDYFDYPSWVTYDIRRSTYYPGTCNMKSDTGKYLNTTTGQMQIGNAYEFGTYSAPRCPAHKIIYGDDGTGTNQLLTIGREKYTYNNYDQLTCISWDIWGHLANDFVVSGQSWKHNFHYEEFTPAAQVNTINEVVLSANIYPVPVINTAYLDLEWKSPQSFSIAIVDVTGKVIKTWKEEGKKHYHTTLDLSSIPNGNYLVEVTAKNEKLTKKFTITH